jgi:hypothetical protein
MEHAKDPGLLAAFQAVLVIDETTAHITACPQQASSLYGWFQGQAMACTWKRGAGMGGLDVIDFGNPSAALEQRIHSQFAAWRRIRSQRKEPG